MEEIIKMLLLVIVQNASFTLVSRARNSDSIMFHGGASILSNTIWLIVIKNVVQNFDRIDLMITYVIGSFLGSVIMHHFSMKYIEKFFKK